MSFLLMVGLTLVCLPTRYPDPWLDLTPLGAAWFALLGVSLIGLHAIWVSSGFRRTLARDPSQLDHLLGRYERGRLVHQIVLMSVYVVLLVPLGWGWAVRQAWSEGGQSLPGTDLATLAPFFLGQLLGWVFFYDADHASHQVTCRLLDADAYVANWFGLRRATLPPFGGRWNYVLYQLRQKLAMVFIPVFMVVGLKECERFLPASWHALGTVLLAGVLICWPWIIRLVLGLKPLPPGPLRDRLTAATRRLGFRCSNILVWSTRQSTANAMVVGLVPWLRYVVFTDRLLDEFDEDEIEAVFGHEIGHIRHQHMLYYLLFLGLSMITLGLVADHLLVPAMSRLGSALANWLPDIFPRELGVWLGPEGDLAPYPIVVLLLGYLFMAFGLLSRHCERQADVYGCRAVSCADVHCQGHGPTTVLVPRAQSLCPTGIATFIRALEKVAYVNGIRRERPGFLQSWQHGSIAQRVEFLERALHEPRAEAQFQRRLLGFKWAAALGLGGLLVLMIRLFGWPEL